MRALNTRYLTVFGFIGLSLLIFAYLFTGSGIRIPGYDYSDWTGYIHMKDVDNSVRADRVQIAGIQVGTVRSVTHENGEVKIEFTIQPKYAPLHQGAQVRLGARSLVGEAYLDITDGRGAELPTETEIPRDAVHSSTEVRDVLATLDAPTRQNLGQLLRSAGAATKDTQNDVGGLMAGLGDLGRAGNTALDAIAAQSDDLEQLGRETTAVLQALNTGDGQIASLVTNADELTSATAGQQKALGDSMRELPPTLDSATTAAADLRDLSGALAPVASNLKEAAPFLSDSLDQLPDVTKDLRGLLPPLHDALDAAPDTLTRISPTDSDIRDVLGPAHSILRDVDPMLKYMQPYGHDIANWIVNLNAGTGYTDESGANYIRLMPGIDEKSLQTPVPYGVLTYENPYPKPLAGANPGPFNGKYPRVERLPN
ncbi:MlaD family protein [Pseudonocardia spinosispora]|uniref:MlaD family protein n=1 Tax=Pseudonocardia spinosispora TaxID=103441 RepID=UPI0004050F3F|nr:MlaD family protein [Pseudonocardia spinosispora]